MLVILLFFLWFFIFFNFFWDFYNLFLLSSFTVFIIWFFSVFWTTFKFSFFVGFRVKSCGVKTEGIDCFSWSFLSFLGELGSCFTILTGGIFASKRLCSGLWFLLALILGGIDGFVFGVCLSLTFSCSTMINFYRFGSEQVCFLELFYLK